MSVDGWTVPPEFGPIANITGKITKWQEQAAAARPGSMREAVFEAKAQGATEILADVVKAAQAATNDDD